MLKIPNPVDKVPPLNARAVSLVTCFALAAVVVIGGARLTGFKEDTTPSSQISELRELRFVDGSDGSVKVIDADTGSEVDTIAPGTNGFLRATMRQLGRLRSNKGIGSGPPFQVVHYDTGHYTLVDPSTGTSVALDAFGRTNARVFARLLEEQKS
jgi:putative photosynthetic complex assembly protein